MCSRSDHKTSAPEDTDRLTKHAHQHHSTSRLCSPFAWLLMQQNLWFTAELPRAQKHFITLGTSCSLYALLQHSGCTHDTGRATLCVLLMAHQHHTSTQSKTHVCIWNKQPQMMQNEVRVDERGHWPRRQQDKSLPQRLKFKQRSGRLWLCWVTHPAWLQGPHLYSALPNPPAVQDAWVQHLLHIMVLLACKTSIKNDIYGGSSYFSTFDQNSLNINRVGTW